MGGRQSSSTELITKHGVSESTMTRGSFQLQTVALHRFSSLCVLPAITQPLPGPAVFLKVINDFD